MSTSTEDTHALRNAARHRCLLVSRTGVADGYWAATAIPRRTTQTEGIPCWGEANYYLLMTDAWYAAGYLARSRYRLAVCNQLYDSGPSLPSELAVATELAQPHVSRALGQLRDEGLVELLVPESKQKGRLYGLTENGRDAVVRLRMRQLEFPVDVVGRDEFPHSSLIEYLESTVPNQMRAVAYHDGDRFVLYFADADIRDQYDEETVTEAAERIWNRQQYESVVDDGTLGARQYVVRGFDRAVVVDVYTEETATVTLSFDPAFDEPISTFVGNCVAHLDRPERT